VSELVKILVIGSSNELGTCWRAFLWQKLRDAGIENFDFVGGVTQGPDCGVDGYDRDLQAQSGNRVSEWEENEVTSWFADTPQIVLLHVGGADVLADLPLQGVMEGFDVALREARLAAPTVEFMNAQHTPMAPAAEGTEALNAAIVTWARDNTTSDSPITAVDLFTDVDTDTDTTDGVHLNDAGSQKVADRFFAALEPLFGRAAPLHSFPE
jgi:mannan endo-1,4-beta-mannosidase